MRLGIIGLGQAGGRIADLFAFYNNKYRGTHGDVVPLTLAVNTAKSDLMGLSHVPKQSRIVLGATLLRGHGAGARRRLAAEIMQDEVADIVKVAMRGLTHIDAYLVCAALGGGTGSGSLPILAKVLQEECEEPIYSLSILPTIDEGSLYSYNAGVCLMELRNHVDAMLLWDNQMWAKIGIPIAKSYAEMNQKMVSAFFPLLWAGEASEASVGSKVLDAGDLIATLDGVCTIGWANEPVHHGWFSFRRTSIEEAEVTTKIMSLVERACRGEKFVECDLKSAQKAAFLVSGRPQDLNRKGIELGRRYLEEVVGGKQVRGGDFPIAKANKLVAVVVFSGLTDVPRVKSILEWAVQAQEHYRRFEATVSQRKEELFKSGESLLK